MELASEKLDFLATAQFADLAFQPILPDEHHNWLHLTETGWDELLPLISKG